MVVESASVNILFQMLALVSINNKVLNSTFNTNLLGETQASSIHIVTRYQYADIFAQVFTTLLIIFCIAHRNEISIPQVGFDCLIPGTLEPE